MSLLLDALKRAEQEKLARQGGGAPAGGAPRAGSPATGPAASLELQPLSQAAEAAAAAKSGGAARPDAAHAAQNVFQAKTAAPASPAAAPREEPRNRTVLWATFGAIAVVATAAGAYVWYSVKALTPPYAATPRPRAAPTPPPASATPLPSTAAMGSIVPAPGTPTTSVEVASEPPRSPGPAPAAVAAAPESPAERIAREATGPAPAPLKMDRGAQAPRRVPAEVASGFQALRDGNLAAARRSYEAAVASDPTSVDAHLGLATIAARGGQRATAVEHYRRALESDPRNATALAGLAALADFARPEALEAQLRADLARLPDSAALHFTLGNLYASEGRWTEAQSAYFEAHRLDPGSGDIAYNLAVSLDQLGQRRVAADFYRRALDSARERSAQFDPAAAARRLEELR